MQGSELQGEGMTMWCKILGHKPEMRMTCRDTLAGPNVYEEYFCDRCGEFLTSTEFDEAWGSWWNQLVTWWGWKRLRDKRIK